jgi:hypothetical protein
MASETPSSLCAGIEPPQVAVCPEEVDAVAVGGHGSSGLREHPLLIVESNGIVHVREISDGRAAVVESLERRSPVALRREGLCPLAFRIQGIPVSGDVQSCRTVHRSIDIIDIDVLEVRGDETWLGFRLSLFFFFREALAGQTTPVPQEELATIRKEVGAVKGKLNVIPSVGIGAVVALPLGHI